MGVTPKADADGNAILVQMCQGCHNGKLDQTQSRARFDASKLASMSPTEKQLAIARIDLPATDRHRMPPVLLGELSQADKDKLTSVLSK